MSHETHAWPALVSALQAAAREVGDQRFLTVCGEAFTFAEAWQHTRAVAAGLRREGLKPGDRVTILSPNRPEAVWAWFGAQAAGGVDVPLNAESRGNQLAYFLADSAPHVLIGTPDLIAELVAVGAPLPPVVVTLDAGNPDVLPAASPEHLTWSALIADALVDEDPDMPVPPPGELASIVYTSGTTGPSKGVMWPHGYYPSMTRQYAEWAGFTRDLSFYCVQPLCHLDSRASVVLALYLRGRTTLEARFSASRFWHDMDDAGANAFVFVGTMLQLLAKQTGPGRAANAPVAVGLGSAIPANGQRELEERFRVRLLEGYGTTEIPLIFACRRDDPTLGTVGTVADSVEVALVDEDDEPVPVGEPGLLLVRPRMPYSMTLGYWQKPEATAAAFVNLWFHTGDLLRERPEGGFEYVGRAKDSIRRRGENVSAWEVEQAALAHPDVLECAAIGIPSPLGDEDVALLVVPRADAQVEAASLVDFMAAGLARFAIPRYVEVVEALPKTPSERINKGEVRARGITDQAVDLQPDAR